MKRGVLCTKLALLLKWAFVYRLLPHLRLKHGNHAGCDREKTLIIAGGVPSTNTQ